jgi:N-acylneuraminate cytidylyltransferase/CMP-N,N'-diacetyllegionaminic acid synthase
VKNKNLRMMIDKPLLAYSILQAKASGCFERIAVSSDSEEILAVARQYGADYTIKRPDEMASDTAAKLPAIMHCVNQSEQLSGTIYDIVVDLDATSPLRKVEDIRLCIQMLIDHSVSNVITGAPARRSPYFNLVELNQEGFVQLSKPLDKPIVRRQDAPKCYDMNASIYVWKRDVLMDGGPLFRHDTMLYEMPEERSVDIDSELDFEVVELLMRKRDGQIV